HSTNNGSVSFYDPETGEVTNNIFLSANGTPLGDVVQSMTIFDTLGFIVVNGSGKLEVVGMKSFKTVSQALYFSYPRYFLPLNNGTGYLSMVVRKE
ncbi:MAG: YncE family protein, partial [Bacteroidales bacterium]|nr:YncE family protein [Bacteroidales bacterium]